MSKAAQRITETMRACARVCIRTWPKSRTHGWMKALFLAACAHAQLSTFVFAQSTGTLRITCEPQATFSYVLDGKYRQKDREITLMEGPHRLVFWAPERRMLDTTISVAPNAVRELRIQLRYSEEFISYNKKLRRYERDNRLLKYGTPALVLGSFAWFGVSVYRGIDAQNDLDRMRTEYAESTNPAGITDLKDAQIPDANKRLRQARVMAGVSGGLMIGTGALWYYLKKSRSERKPPVFEDKEKARFDGLAFVPSNDGHGVWMAALTIPLR